MVGPCGRAEGRVLEIDAAGALHHKEDHGTFDPAQFQFDFWTMQLLIWQRALNILRASAPGIAVLSAALVIAEVVAVFGVLFGIRTLVDALAVTDSAALDEDAMGQILGVLAWTAALVAASVGLSVANTYVLSRQGILVGEHVDGLVQRKATTIDFAFYESPEYFDTLQRARQSGSQRPAQIITRGLAAARNALYLGGALMIIGSIEWRIIPAVLLVVGAVLFIRLKYTRSLFQWVRRRAQLERRAVYHDFLMTSELSAKEVRIGRLGDRLRGRFVMIRRLVNDTHLEILHRQSRAELLTAALGAVVFAGSIWFLVLETAAGRQTVGDLVFFVLVFRRAETSGREFVTSISQLYDDQLYLSQLFEFLDVQSRILAPAEPLPVPPLIEQGLRMEGVRFRYPGSGTETLSDINLLLPAGQVVGLVGENGSGKTSVVKLLLRYYEPDEGRIMLDGTDIRSFDPESYRARFSTIFQDHVRYAATASENILFGAPDPEPDHNRMVRAARQSGVDELLQSLPQGYDTPLSRVFEDGREISIGQWQRVAVARALYPVSDFVILDEPTSAIDAQAEAQLFEEFRIALNGRSALLISHRLTSLRHADFIYVMQAGRVVEQGTFHELVAKDTEFRKLFAAQFTDGFRVAAEAVK
jgi:ATP-binding cassette, subfamily B, bacterial